LVVDVYADVTIEIALTKERYFTCNGDLARNNGLHCSGCGTKIRHIARRWLIPGPTMEL